MWAWRKKAPALTAAQALSAKPIRLVDPDVQRHEQGARLTVRLRETRWLRVFRVPAGATKTFELDELGLFVWDRIDGRTSVKQIISALASHYRLNLREAEVATQTFLRTLMSKGLVGMPIQHADGPAKP